MDLTHDNVRRSVGTKQGISMRKFFTMAAVAAMVLPAAPAEARRLKVGQPVPNVELTMIDGTTVHLADLRGKVVVLNFWATWCAPCKKELPLLDTYYRIQKDAGLRVFAVTTEDSLPTRKLLPLFKLMAIPSAKRVKGGVFADVEVVPTNYVIDRAGVLRYAQGGAFSLDQLNGLLVPLLREPAPPGTAAN